MFWYNDKPVSYIACTGRLRSIFLGGASLERLKGRKVNIPRSHGHLTWKDSQSLFQIFPWHWIICFAPSRDIFSSLCANYIPLKFSKKWAVNGLMLCKGLLLVQRIIWPRSSWVLVSPTVGSWALSCVYWIFFHPGLFSTCPGVWVPWEAAGKPLQPHQCPTEDTRAAGGSEEDAAKREPPSTNMERGDLEKKRWEDRN